MRLSLDLAHSRHESYEEGFTTADSVEIRGMMSLTARSVMLPRTSATSHACAGRGLQRPELVSWPAFSNDIPDLQIV